MQQKGPPDAIAGPYNEIPALELSVLATGMKIPIVAHRAFDQNLLLPERHPYYSQVSADFYSEMEIVGEYLKYVGREDYIAVVYSSAASVQQKVDILRVVLEKRGFGQVRTFSYRSSDMLVEGTPDRNIRSALQRVKETGFRTIIVLLSRLDADAPEIGHAAAEFGLDQGGHFWMISGGIAEMSMLEANSFLGQSPNIGANWLKGAAYLFPYDAFELNRVDFRGLLRQQDLSFIQGVQVLNPIEGYAEKEIQEVAGEEYPLRTIMANLSTFAQGTSFMVRFVVLLPCWASRNSTISSFLFATVV
jgi:hypothetical protein